MQNFYYSLKDLNIIIDANNFNKVLIISGRNTARSPIVCEVLKNLEVEYGVFNSFTPNPKLTEAEQALKFYIDGNFDSILAIGGGSALDVAKYVKLKAQTGLIAVPTTAGSGSESTRFAVLYDNGKKLSVNSLEMIPEFVVFESKFLETLPEYQKKSTILDALCHSIESFWSVNSTEQSKEIAARAIKIILNNYKRYLNNEREVYNNILLASNLAGQAINITQTTAGHAMSYKLTSTFNIAHGHAVALCLSKVWEFLNENIEQCCDSRGEEYLRHTLRELNSIISPDDFNSILDYFQLDVPQFTGESQLDMFVDSVNVERLSNFPIKLTSKDIRAIYLRLFETTKIY